MLLLIQIALTVAAWQKGWKALALLPIAIAVGLGFCLGLAVEIDGGGMEAMIIPALLVDLGCIAALIVMAVRGRQTPGIAVPEPVKITGDQAPLEPKHAAELDKAA